MTTVTHRAVVTLLLTVALAPAPVEAEPAAIAGDWGIPDEDTGVVESVIRIRVEAGTARGTIHAIVNEPNGGRELSCEHCPGELLDRPYLGLPIIDGFTLDGDAWRGGRILDPESGHYYNSTMRLRPGGDELEVRGYFLVPLLGRTMVWRRVGNGE